MASQARQWAKKRNWLLGKIIAGANALKEFEAMFGTYPASREGQTNIDTVLDIVRTCDNYGDYCEVYNGTLRK